MENYISYVSYLVQETIELIQEFRRENRRLGDIPDELERLQMWVAALENSISN